MRHVLAMHTVHGFLQISKVVTCQSRGVSKIGDFNQIIVVLVSAWNVTLNYKWIIGLYTCAISAYLSCQFELLSWQDVLIHHYVIKFEKTTNLSKVTDKLHHIMLYRIHHSHDGPLCHWQTWSHIYTIYIHCQKIYNLFVQALERDVMGAFGKFVWSAL
jgi:hypothetical protein